MNGIEALQEALKGKKIRRSIWRNTRFVEFTYAPKGANFDTLKVKLLRSQDGFAEFISEEGLVVTDWEIYVEIPIDSE